MTIKEVEALLDMPRANIRFYEQQGLLAPKRAENGYREYTPEDLHTLEKVRLLRGLGCSVEEIRDIQSGCASMAGTLADKEGAFRRSKNEIETAREICEAIRKEGASFQTLDAKKYESGAWRAMAKPVSAPVEALSYKAYPWRRFLARALDYALCSALWKCLLGAFLRVNLAVIGARFGWQLLDTAASLLLMLLLEPLFLHCFQTTPGKWIFGIRIEGYSGEKLPYRAGANRVLSVIWHGLGLFLPVYSLVRLWKSYRAVADGQDMPWEDESLLTVSDAKPWRGAVFALACAVPLAMIPLAVNLSMLPPNREVNTVAAFAENYNHYADYYEIGAYRLTNTGEWDISADGVVIVNWDTLEAPEFAFEEEGGALTGVSFRIEQKDAAKYGLAQSDLLGIISLDMLSVQAQISALSYLGASASAFSGDRWALLKGAELADFGGFEWKGDAGTMEMAVEYAGYESPSPELLFALEGEKTEFTAAFAMRAAKNGETSAEQQRK